MTALAAIALSGCKPLYRWDSIRVTPRIIPPYRESPRSFMVDVEILDRSGGTRESCSYLVGEDAEATWELEGDSSDRSALLKRWESDSGFPSLHVRFSCHRFGPGAVSLHLELDDRRGESILETRPFDALIRDRTCWTLKNDR